MQNYYSADGTFVGFLDENRRWIYATSGSPLGFLQEEFVYSASGKLLGYYRGRWIEDVFGAAALFTTVGGGRPAVLSHRSNRRFFDDENLSGGSDESLASVGA